MVNYGRVVCEAVLLAAVIALATAAPSHRMKHKYYDQRQTGKENYRLSIDGVLFAVVPEGFLTLMEDRTSDETVEILEVVALEELPTESKPLEDKLSVKPLETAVEEKPLEVKPVEKSVEYKPLEEKPLEENHSEKKILQLKLVELKPLEETPQEQNSEIVKKFAEVTRPSDNNTGAIKTIEIKDVAL